MKISEADRGMAWVLFLEVIPCLLIGLGVEYWGLQKWGDKSMDYAGRVLMEPAYLYRYIGFHFVMGLAMIMLGAYLLHAVAQSFSLRSTYSQAVNAIGYGMLPLFLCHAIDAIPGLNTWIPWAIGVLISASFLYHGVAMCLKPEQTKGFGLFVFSLIFVGGMSGLVQFIGSLILRGRILRSGTEAIAMLL